MILDDNDDKLTEVYWISCLWTLFLFYKTLINNETENVFADKKRGGLINILGQFWVINTRRYLA